MDWSATYRVPTNQISEDITSEVSSNVFHGGVFDGYTVFKIPNKYYTSSGSFRLLSLSSPFTLRAEHEYSVSFGYGQNFTTALKCDIYLYVYTASGDLFKSIPLYSSSSRNAYSVTSPEFNFLVKASDLPEGYFCRFSVLFEQSGSANTTLDGLVFISPQIELTDLDDNLSWLERILQAILDIPQKIKHLFTNLGNQIGGFFSDLGDKIGGFFKDIGDTIKQKFNDLKQWFNDLGDRISGFFDDLKLKIETKIQGAVDEIKSWFIPSDGYFEEYKTEWETWARERFGVLIQIPDLFIDLFHRLGNLMTFSSYTFTFPEISVPIGGKTYVFVNEQTVDMSYWLNSQTTTKYLYDVYGICVFAVFAFALLKYTLKVQKDIFEG